MRKIALALLVGLLPCAAIAQNAPATLPYHTLWGRIGATPGDTGPAQAIPFATLFNQFVIGTQSANTVYAGPTSGGVASPTFRALIGTDLPVPSASTLGGVESLAAVTSKWINTISTAGVPSATQPAFTDISGTATNAQLANMAGNTVKANATGSSAAPTDFAMPSCSGAAQALKYTTSAGIGCVTYAPASSNKTIASATAANSTSAFTMQGFAGSITPATTGTVMITISGYIAMGAFTAVNVGATYQISYGTGSAPTSNAALTGTQVGSTPEYTNPEASFTSGDINVPFSISVVVSGLTVGTTYWIDLAVKALTSASGATFTQVNIAAMES